MNPRRHRLMLVLLPLLAGCATMTRGSTATVTISTTPPGAACTLTRNGAALGAIPATPGTISFPRQAGDILVACEKPDYRPVSITETPLTGTELTPVIGGAGAIAALVDSASGANYRYRREIPVDPVPLDAAPDAPPRPLVLDNLRLR